MPLRPVGGAIARALRALHLDVDVARAAAMNAWPGVATRVIGADAVRTKAVRTEDDTLVVAVPTPQWASEIRLRERELVRSLREAAPGCGIGHIRSVPVSNADRRAESPP